MNRWTGVVLAGGRSSRMGQDKALLVRGGSTMLEHALDLLEPVTDELMTVGDPKKYGHILPNTVADIRSTGGPLAGVATALQFASNDRCLIIGCDMPALTASLFELVKQGMGADIDAVIPRHEGLLEPLAGAYHRNCLPVFRNCLDQDVFKMSDALALVRTTFVEVKPGRGHWPSDLFRNINQKEDL